MRSYVGIGLLAIALSCTYEHLEKAATFSCNGSSLSLTYSVNQPSTCSSQDGSLKLRASGGLPGYSFKLNDGSFSRDTLFANLSPGNYTATVRDSMGCTASKVISLNSLNSNIQISAVATADADCTNSGSITVSVTGGKKPYKYSLNSGTAQVGNVFKGLSAATYSINVTDSTNCQASSSTTVASKAPSFANDIQTIISSNCATNGCHGSSGRSPNLSSYSGISSNGTSVVGAINNNMPPGSRLQQQQINLITCWVKSGAPNN